MLLEIISVVGLVWALREMFYGGIFSFWGNFIDTLPEYLAKPLGACELCFGTWFFILFTVYKHYFEYGIFVEIGLFYFLLGLFDRLIYTPPSVERKQP